MRLDEAYGRLWQAKLVDCPPPDQQHTERVRMTAELFPADATGPLLDIGCGSGAMLAVARQREWKAGGLEFDPVLVEWLNAHGYGAYCGDASTDVAPLHEVATYGIVTACDVIEHLIDPGHMLREAYRLLRPGGRIYVATPNSSHWRRVLSLINGQMFRTSGDEMLRDGGHLGYYAPLDLAHALRAAGFRGIVIHFRCDDPCPDDQATLLERLGAQRQWLDRTYLIAEGVK